MRFLAVGSGVRGRLLVGLDMFEQAWDDGETAGYEAEGDFGVAAVLVLVWAAVLGGFAQADAVGE